MVPNLAYPGKRRRRETIAHGGGCADFLATTFFLLAALLFADGAKDDPFDGEPEPPVVVPTQATKGIVPFSLRENGDSPSLKIATAPRKIREIFVPFDDLNVLLENQPRRVLLRRSEYDALVKKAKQAPENPRRAAVLVAAEYEVAAERAAGPDRRHAGDRRAGDGPARPAAGPGRRGPARREARRAATPPIGRDPDGRLNLLVEGVGRHA